VAESCAPPPAIGVEQAGGRFALDDEIGDRVRVLFVAVTLLTHATLELNPVALLDHVRCFVSRGVQVGGGLERDVVAGRVRRRADRVARCRRCATDVRLDGAHVVPLTERALDRLPMRQCATTTGDAGRCGGLDVAGLPPHGTSLGLDRGIALWCEPGATEIRTAEHRT
jgi:hypothetical protein